MNVAFFKNSTVSPIDHVEYFTSANKSIKLSIKRDDLIDPFISGNKWRKLKHNFFHAEANNYSSIATFGGAFSNHIAATARAGYLANINTIGFIRSHEIDFANPTLALAHQHGMKLIAMSRLDYKRRHEPDFLNDLTEAYPDSFFIPEGGSNQYSPEGFRELAEELTQQLKFDVIACPVGSGGTISGLATALPNRQIVGVATVDDTPLLTSLEQEYAGQIAIHKGALFGGYGKFDQELENFCIDFFQQTGVPIEPIYSGKLFYALCYQRESLNLDETQTLLAIHTGGLQGLKGMLYRNKLQHPGWSEVMAAIAAE